MKNLPQLFFFLFTISAFTNLWSEVMDWRLGVLISKPLLMTTLGLFFWVSTRKKMTYLRFFILLGLLFSLFGDSFLMFSGRGNAFFLLGLSSFFITHLFYGIGFWKYPSEEKGLVQNQPLWSFPFLLFLVLNSWMLWDGLEGAMKIPVILYSLVISMMAITALNLKGKVDNKTFHTIFGGAILFMISDALIGLSKFGGIDGSTPLIRSSIMATYILGQYLIVKGAIQANEQAKV